MKWTQYTLFHSNYDIHTRLDIYNIILIEISKLTICIVWEIKEIKIISGGRCRPPVKKRKLMKKFFYAYNIRGNYVIDVMRF